MDLAKLGQLKKVLVESKDIEKAFHYFMDHFGEDNEFLDLGKPARNELLEGIIGAVVGKMFGGKYAVVSFLLIPIPNTPFIHGACQVNGRPANVLYFEDIQVGALGVMMGGPDGMIQYSRFSGRMMPTEGFPHKN